MTKEYGSSEIVALEGLQPVRKRPGMYIGSTGKQGFHHLLWEVVDNSVDEAMGGHANRIEVTLHADGSATVTDNGRGIPVEPQKSGSYKGMPTVVMVCTVLHAGGKFGTGAYAFSGGLHGVGISVVNALTRWMNIEVKRDGKIHTVGFAAQDVVKGGKPEVEPGVLVAPIKSKRNPGKDETGTSVTFLPDERVFSHNDWDSEYVARRLRQTAFLNPGLTCVLTDAEGTVQEFFFPGGISDFMKEVAEARLASSDHAGQTDRLMPLEPISLGGAEEEGEWVMTMQWHPDNKYQVLSFANGIETIDHGTHVEGYQSVLTTIMTKYARQDHIGILTEKDSNFEASDVRSGLGVIISVKVHEPQFQGQTKGKLGNEEIKTLVRQGFNAQFWDWMQNHPTEIKMVLTKAVNEMRMRKKLAAMAEIERAKQDNEGAIAPRSQPLPAKLSDCESKDRSRAELFIVEGDSAAGPALMSRDPQYQAVLPIRGKGLNIEKALAARAAAVRSGKEDRIANNAEVQAILASVGAGSESKFDLSASRFSKIIILTDADDDGAHIETLLMTLFFHLMRPMVEAGNIYVARSPLFSTVVKDEKVYAHSIDDKDRIDRASRAQLTWTRFKGLGEMEPEQLGETAIDPKTRRIAQVSMPSAEEAGFVITQLMGGDAAPKWTELSQVIVDEESAIV